MIIWPCLPQRAERRLELPGLMCATPPEKDFFKAYYMPCSLPPHMLYSSYTARKHAIFPGGQYRWAKVRASPELRIQGNKITSEGEAVKATQHEMQGRNFKLSAEETCQIGSQESNMVVCQ